MLLNFLVTLLRTLCGYFAHEREVVVEASADIRSNIGRSKFSAVLLRLVTLDVLARGENTMKRRRQDVQRTSRKSRRQVTQTA